MRDTVIDDKEIKQDDFMGIGDQGILAVGKELEATVLDMIEQLIDEDSAIVSIYYGEDAQGRLQRMRSVKRSQRRIRMSRWKSTMADSRSIIT